MVKGPSYRINHQIKSPKVRVIDAKGEQVGVMTTADALKLANEKELDLVEVASSAKPPVVKIINFKRWLFRKEKEEKKKRRSELKEFRVRPNIGDHDLQLRASRAEKFLRGGDRVKLTVIFRGRELSHPEIGLEKLKKMTELLRGVGKPEKDPARVGRGYEITFVSSKNG